MKKILLFTVIISVCGVLIVLVANYFSSMSTLTFDQSSKKEAHSLGVTHCPDASCLLASLKTCSSTDFINNEGGAIVQYTVLGPDAEDCLLRLEVTGADEQSVAESCNQYPEFKDKCLENAQDMLSQLQPLVGIKEVCHLPSDLIRQVGVFEQLTDVFGDVCQRE